MAGRPKTAAPTSSNPPTDVPTSVPSMAPSFSSRPSVATYALEITIHLDGASSETGWRITSVDDGVVVISRPSGYYSGNDSQTITEIVRLEAGNYVFTVLDSKGDGFCCQQGKKHFSCPVPLEVDNVWRILTIHSSGSFLHLCRLLGLQVSASIHCTPMESCLCFVKGSLGSRKTKPFRLRLFLKPMMH